MPQAPGTEPMSTACRPRRAVAAVTWELDPVPRMPRIIDRRKSEKPEGKVGRTRFEKGCGARLDRGNQAQKRKRNHPHAGSRSSHAPLVRSGMESAVGARMLCQMIGVSLSPSKPHEAYRQSQLLPEEANSPSTSVGRDSDSVSMGSYRLPRGDKWRLGAWRVKKDV